MADGSVPVVLSPVPFSREVQTVEVRAGTTIRAGLTDVVMRGALALDDLPRVSVYVDGGRLDRGAALDHVLAEGQIVNIVVEPLGGGGGGRKDVGQILLTIAVVAVSAWVGGGSFLPSILSSAFRQQVAAAVVLTLGQAAVAAIFKPETAAQAKVNERYALQSASNQYRPWQAFPLALGSVVVAPDMAVKTFTQAIGDEVWIYGILGLHYGACTVSELKIGDTLVSSMGAGDFRMAQHLTPGPREFSIYANDVDQLDVQEELQATTGSATPVVRAGSGEGERFEFDFFLPAGLHYAKDDGRLVAASVTVTIRYRPIDNSGNPTGGGDWMSGTTMPLTSATNEPWRLTRDLTLPLGRYEFEIVRSNRVDNLAKRHDDIALTAIRSIAFRKPVNDENLSIIEFAARATALNQGTLAPITCRVTPLCETWTGTEWGPPAPTSNPAALTRWLMTGPAPAKPLTSDEADVQLREWSMLCDEYDWKAAFYLIEDRKQDAVLGMLEQAGRASLFWDGTQLVASPWVEKPIPRQLFTDENLKDHRWTIVYPDEVHALRVEFQNIDEGGDPDELYVYADGYAEVAGPNVQAAVLVEAMRVEGQKTAERAYRDGRWELGRRLHQRRIDTWTTDIEHVVSRYGDRVRLAWQRATDGASARVRCRLWSGGQVIGLRLTQAVEMLPGEDYAMDMRLVGGLHSGVSIANPAVTTAVVTRVVMFDDARDEALSPRAGDLVAFGVANHVSEDVEIIGIEPGGDLTAVITGIRYVAPLLMAGETGPIPPLQSRLTRQRSLRPPAPTLLGVQIDDTGVRIAFAMPRWQGSPISGFAARWRPKPRPGRTAGWASLPPLGAAAMRLQTPPLREFPDETDDVTSVEVEIIAQTVSGHASLPLIVSAGQAVVDSPTTDWSVQVRGPDAQGTQQPGLIVTLGVTAQRAASVLIEYAISETGPWVAAFDGPPTTTAVDIVGLQPGLSYWVGVTYRSAQGVPGARMVEGHYVAPNLIAGDLTDGGRASLITALRDQLSDTAAAERLAETLIQTILDEQESYELEAERRLNADTGVLNEATSHTDNSIAEAMNLVYTRAETDAGYASTLQVAKSYTDVYKSEAELLFSTKTERANGDATSVLQAKAYTDDFKSEAGFIYATQAALGSGLASTLTAAQSYTSGSISTALNTVYTRAQTDAGLATTLQAARAHTDTLRSDAALTYATSASLGGVSATASQALTVAVSANGVARAAITNVLDVNGFISGTRSENDGVRALYYILTDVFGLISPNGGDRTEFIGGIWYAYPADNSSRSMWGKPFGGAWGLVWWTGPTSVPIGQETKSNAFVYVSMNTYGGGRFGGSDVAGAAAPLGLELSSELAFGSSAAGGGYAYTNTLTFTPTGTGAGSATIRLVKTDGTAGNDVVPYQTGNAAFFGGTVAPGTLTRAIYLAIAVSGSQTATRIFDVQLSDPT